MNIKITGSGSYIPEIVQDNSKFLDREFFDNEGNKIETKNLQYRNDIGVKGLLKKGK